MGQMFYYLALLIMASLVFIIVLKFICGIRRFSRDIRYLNSEIHRTHGEERKSWIRKKKRTFRNFIKYLLY